MSLKPADLVEKFGGIVLGAAGPPIVEGQLVLAWFSLNLWQEAALILAWLASDSWTDVVRGSRAWWQLGCP